MDAAGDTEVEAMMLPAKVDDRAMLRVRRAAVAAVMLGMVATGCDRTALPRDDCAYRGEMASPCPTSPGTTQTTID